MCRDPFDCAPSPCGEQSHAACAAQLCAISCNVQTLAVMASTLAAGGYDTQLYTSCLLADTYAFSCTRRVNPLTHEEACQTTHVKHCLSCLYSCGMYDASGAWSFSVGNNCNSDTLLRSSVRSGLPAKSGVSGAMFVVIPQLMGLAIYSPPLDQHGNPVRGVRYLQVCM